jgi:hypothetical protein
MGESTDLLSFSYLSACFILCSKLGLEVKRTRRLYISTLNIILLEVGGLPPKAQKCLFVCLSPIALSRVYKWNFEEDVGHATARP